MYVTISGPGREGTPRLTPCQQARLNATAHDHDEIQSWLIRQLNLRIDAREKAKIVQRVSELTIRFKNLEPQQARALRSRLNNPADNLGRLFDCELHHKTRERLRKLLDTRAALPNGGRRIPPSPPPPPSPSPKKQPPPSPKKQPPRIIFDPPPRLPRIRIRIPDLLEHARRLLEFLQVAGLTVGIVMTLIALAAAIKAVERALITFAMIGVTKYLVYDLATGKLSLEQPPDASYETMRRIARASMAVDELAKLQNALRELQRLDERALERLEQLPPVLTPDSGVPRSGPPDAGPPPGDGGEVPRRRRTVTGYHGAKGDAILGILSSGRMRPQGGMVWLNLGDYRQSYEHGGDRKRGASFVAEVQVTYDPAVVTEERKPTAGIPHTLVLRTREALAASVLRMYRRRRTEEGRAEDVFEGRAAIEAALR
jgi:hypothetical protein